MAGSKLKRRLMGVGSFLMLHNALNAPAAAGSWWDPNGEGLCVWGAWQAKGAADYATSLTDLSGNGHTLTEGNGAVPWAAGTGWTFTAASAQYLITTFIPQNDQSQTMLVQYTNSSVNSTVIAGARTAAGRSFYIIPALAGNDLYCVNGGSPVSQVAPGLGSGNVAIAGDLAYRNGVSEGVNMGAWTGASSQAVYIGATNFEGVASYFITGEIQAVAIYDCTLTVAQVAMIAGQMAAL